MDKKRIELMITAALVFILIFSWANSAKILKKRRRVLMKAVAGGLQQKANMEKGEDWVSLKWSRDPFYGRVYSAAGEGLIGLQLQGILWDEKKPHALISEEIVSEGDSVGNNIVIKINKDSVLLNDGTKDLELKLE